MTGGAGAQSALPFPVGGATGASDFLVGAANRAAAAWIDRWPAWPAPGLAVHGPPGCGKSHLLAIWARRSGARRTAAAEVGAAPPERFTGARAVAVDDVDAALEAGGHERALLRLYNAVAARRGALLLAAARPPARWPVALADLRSRVRALPAVAIGKPDDALLAAVLVKLFADRRAIVEPALIDYLVGRIERSFAAARRIVARADRAAWEQGRAITIPLVRTLLPSGGGEGHPRGE